MSKVKNIYALWVHVLYYIVISLPFGALEQGVPVNTTVGFPEKYIQLQCWL